MIYSKVVKGIFIQRPNRFVAHVNIDGEIETVHVKNTGRCKELLIEGATVYLEDFKDKMGNRKLRYSLISVEKDTKDRKILINMDSQAPNKIVEEALYNKLALPAMSNISHIKREFSFEHSRFDFYVEDDDGNKGFIEVKGVTLENDGLFQFPDAPTERGVKHIKHLTQIAKNKACKAYIIFVVQMDKYGLFMPNKNTDKAFSKALSEAYDSGVHILVYNCAVSFDNINLKDEIPFKLD